MKKTQMTLLIIGLIVLLAGCIMRVMENPHSNTVLIIGCGIIIVRSFFRNHEKNDD